MKMCPRYFALPAVSVCLLCLVVREFALGAPPVSSGARPADAKAAGSQKPLSAAGEAALAGHLKAAFEEGYTIGPKRLAEAQRHLDLARRAAPGDARVDYATALIYCRQSQYKPAAGLFDAVAKRDDAHSWPAWQAAIWTQLVDKQNEAGLKRLGEYAAVVQKAEKADEVSEAQRDAARWIGQLIEALTQCADSQKAHDQIVAAQVQLLDTFGDELLSAVDAGRDSIRYRDFELERAAGAADKEKERRAQDKASKLEKDIAGLGKAKEDAAKSAEEWKEWLDDILAKSDKQLELLERDYTFLDERVQSLSQLISQVGQQISVLQLGMSNINVIAANPFGSQNAQFQLQQRQNQMLAYQIDYNTTVGRLQAVAQQGAQAMRERADAVKRYETATGQLVKKNSNLDKWTSRLKNEKQKLTLQKPGDKAKKAPTDKKQPTLKTYLPFDFDIEKERVLASFANAAKADDAAANAGDK